MKVFELIPMPPTSVYSYSEDDGDGYGDGVDYECVDDRSSYYGNGDDNGVFTGGGQGSGEIVERKDLSQETG